MEQAVPGVVVVGAGQAGAQTASSLRQGGFTGPVTIVGDEPLHPYHRPPLSKRFLTDPERRQPACIWPEGWAGGAAVQVLLDEQVTGIDRQTSRVITTRRFLPYRTLVLATGSSVRRLPGVDPELRAVVHLRSAADAQTLRNLLPTARDVVIIGGGFIGLEVAAAARTIGADHVTVIERADGLLGRTCTPHTARLIDTYHRECGTRILTGTGVRELVGNGAVAEVVLTDGRRLPADLVVVGIGVVPNTGLAAAAGLEIANGIVVDSTHRTADRNIMAIGDCANVPTGHGRRRFESVHSAVAQARAAAGHLLGDSEPYAETPWFSSEQGARAIRMVGESVGYDEFLPLSPAPDSSTVLCFVDDRLCGVETVNRPAEHMAARRLFAGAHGLTRAQAAAADFTLRRHVAQLPALA